MVRQRIEQVADRNSDYRVHEDDPASLVAARLRRSGYPFLRAIKCENHDGLTVLAGSVPTYYLKQLAQSLALHTPGVREVENRVHVTSTVYRTRASTAG